MNNYLSDVNLWNKSVVCNCAHAILFNYYDESNFPLWKKELEKQKLTQR